MEFLTDMWMGSQQQPIFGYVVRAIIIYFYIFLMVKVIGQRSMASIDPLDFIFGVVIGDVLGEPISNAEVELSGPMAGAAMIAFTHWLLSFVSLKLPRFRRVVENAPYLVMENGQIHEGILKKAGITVEALLMETRQNNVSDLNEVDYAVLEPNGKLSVLKKNRFEALTPEDMGQSPVDAGYPRVVIADGQVLTDNMDDAITDKQLLDILKNEGYSSVKEIFLFTLDKSGKYYISPRGRV